MKRTFPRSVAARAFVFALLGGVSAVASPWSTEVIVSVPDQVLAIVDRGRLIAKYPISTSKFGIGDSAGSYRTPLGTLFVSAKFGDNLPPGAVIKNRVPTGEVVTANAPGRDPIVARVIWLRGMEAQNRGARDRCIYIHGTPEERRIGKPASFGCIRMRSRDLIALYNSVHIGHARHHQPKADWRFHPSGGTEPVRKIGLTCEL